MIEQRSLANVKLLHNAARICLHLLCEGWHEYVMGVCVDTQSMVKIGALTFRAKSLNGAEAVISEYLSIHPILTLNLFDVAIQPVDGNAEPYFTPVEQLCNL